MEPSQHIYTFQPENSDQNSATRVKLQSILKFVVINSAFVIYFVFATLKYIERRDALLDGEMRLTLCSPFGTFLMVSGCTYSGFLYFLTIKPLFGKTINHRLIKPVRNFINRSRIGLAISAAIAFVIFIIFETSSDFTRLRSLFGISLIVFILFALSAHRKQIKWHPVICGFVLQFLLGIFCIRMSSGRAIFECIGQKVAAFLDFAKDGARFVYGEQLVVKETTFAFAVLPVIFFFSMCISMLYYIGIIQWVLFKLGWVLQAILGTTVIESLNACINIFLSMSEGPLMLQPYLPLLTDSEIHAVMVSGLATVSGSVFAAYMSFGAEAKHLVTASVMAAPASLFVSKLIYPETEESKTSSSNLTVEKSTDSSLLEAAANGIAQSVKIVLNIIANVVAMIAFTSFVDSITLWATSLVGFDDVGILFILGKVFIPISWAIGVDWKDCDAVGKVIGTKTIVNEFVAYELLGKYKRDGEISIRSAVIATYSICSFAHPTAVAIMNGVLTALAPEKQQSISKVAFRAFIGGWLVPLITASIASLFITDEMF